MKYIDRSVGELCGLLGLNLVPVSGLFQQSLICPCWFHGVFQEIKPKRVGGGGVHMNPEDQL